jgi:hypothetical protein
MVKRVKREIGRSGGNGYGPLSQMEMFDVESDIESHALSIWPIKRGTLDNGAVVIKFLFDDCRPRNCPMDGVRLSARLETCQKSHNASAGRSTVPAAALRGARSGAGCPLSKRAKATVCWPLPSSRPSPGKTPEGGGGDTKRKTKCDLLH